LHEWFGNNPHLDHSGELVNRASLLEICLGLGILLNDACIVLFTEGDYSEGVPDYIMSSRWDPSDFDKLVEYTLRLQVALWPEDNTSRYVN